MNLYIHININGYTVTDDQYVKILEAIEAVDPELADEIRLNSVEEELKNDNT